MKFISYRAYFYEKEARAKYLQRLNGRDAALLVRPHMVYLLDRSRLVRQVAVFDEVQLLFLAKDTTTLSEIPLAQAMLDESQSSGEVEEVNLDMSSSVADLNNGKNMSSYILWQMQTRSAFYIRSRDH
jgi:hypothetical protein